MLAAIMRIPYAAYLRISFPSTARPLIADQALLDGALSDLI